MRLSTQPFGFKRVFVPRKRRCEPLMFRGSDRSDVFVGHGLFAFALAALVAERRGWPARRALTLGVVAGTFAALPDVDVAYAPVAIDGGRFLGGGSVRPDVFWTAANSVHRSMTHSLLVAAVAGPAFGAWTSRRGVLNALSLVVLSGVVGVAVAVSGLLGGIVMGAFVIAGVATATACRRRTDLRPAVVGVAATAGLASHPWGDLLTGQPPQLFYPVDTGVLGDRIALHADPTIHLLGAFAVELAVVWLAAITVVRVADRSWGAFYAPSALPGAAYSVAPLVLVPPTLEVSFHFVFSILGVGLVCAGLARYRAVPTPSGAATGTGSTRRSWFDAGVSGLAGTTVALVGYVTMYLAG